MGEEGKKILVMAAFVFGAAVATAAPLRLALAPGSTLWLAGDSTLHPFTSTATLLSVDGSVDGATLKDVARSAFGELTLRVPVSGLRSKEKALDRNMHKTLKNSVAPEILFVIKRGPLSAALADNVATALDIPGVLTVAGVSKDIVVRATATLDSAALRLTGVRDVLMTDHGIKPPTMLGVIKTQNKIIIHFDLIFELAEAGVESPSFTDTIDATRRKQ